MITIKKSGGITSSDSKMNKSRNSIFQRFFRFRLSIYGQVIYAITILSVFLFVSYAVIFRSVNEEYMQSVIRQSGNLVSSLVQSSLYRSMLRNDSMELRNTMAYIDSMPCIDGIHIYDKNHNLVTSTLTGGIVNPNCRECHADIARMININEKDYKVISLESECEMNQKHFKSRHLLIRTPVFNDRSCYTSACHAHTPDEKILGSIVIISPLGDIDTALEKASADFFILAAVTTLLFLFFIIVFTRRKIKKPLFAIIRTSQAVAMGDKTARLLITPNLLEDIRTVSVVFAEMIDKLCRANTELENWSKQLEYKVQKKSETIMEIQKELINIEKMVSLGKLSSSVAHEINNPLSCILTYSKLVHKQLDKTAMGAGTKESVIKYLGMMEMETQRCGEIVKGLLDFSRKDNENFEKKRLSIILKEAYDLMLHRTKIADINFYTDFTAGYDTVNCSKNQIKQACIALLVNACEAVNEGGEIILKTSNPDNNNIAIEIIDNGIGIAPEDIPHVFEPFFSAKHKERGIGLGLAIVYGIVQSHKGKIDVKSELGKGTVVTILLPLVS